MNSSFFKDKTLIFGLIQRNVKMVGKVVKNTSVEQLTPIIQKYVNPSSIIYTDEWHGYKEANKLYDHHYVDHASRQLSDNTLPISNLSSKSLQFRVFQNTVTI